MALTKDKKHQIVDEMSKLLSTSKITVVADYRGTSVKAMQTLRRTARDEGTSVHVIKNRLAIKALQSADKLKGVDVSALSGMLLYAFNDVDEAAPAQVLAKFAKTEPTLAFVGAITADGNFMNAADVTALAALPGKQQLRAQLVGTIAAPLSGFINVVAGNVRGVLNVLKARAESMQG